MFTREKLFYSLVDILQKPKILDSGTRILQNRELFHNHWTLYLLHALHATIF